MEGLLLHIRDPETMSSSPILLDSSSAVPYPLLRHSRAAGVATTSAAALSHSRPSNPGCIRISLSLSLHSPKQLAHFRRRFSCRSGGDSPPSNSSDDDCSVINDGGGDDDDYLVDCLADGKTEELLGDEGVFIEIEKLGRNTRRIRSIIGIEASLDAVWSVLTDYERLSDFIPGLEFSELVEKKGNYARVYQIGQQNLPMGLKFNAKGVLDCYEKELEILPQGMRREIEFKMVEGDFQLFEGKWSIEQFNRGSHGNASGSRFKDFPTTLSYLVDVKPKLWLPVRLVEGRLSNEIKTNLSCIREAAQKVIESALQDL